ncbi:TPA: hypothetical protein K8N54_004657 [Serratia marcescens]|uniref:DUF2326 domain-containing protein n=1 Tax=Serratia marcescens SM39 TaxID=1334564 RepID=A0AAT9F5M3_SERMA|nr:hypothetical protein [Serratia marcescens]BAO36723.1 hypothetical protein SM39_4809 [Serratia marcescens SM39]BCZ39067.1 hypothetical protein SMGES_03930 [Serratia marcescens]HBI6269226.1 hypothetical protein [Serratia marcescens]HBI6950282.1 hypothetical protein [Serratia marcescens]HBI6960308.1 hypothetical protein [Serratia marcescens]
MQKPIKTKISGMDVVFSQTLIVLASNPEIEFHGDFKLRIKFDVDKKEGDKGEITPHVKTSIQDGLNLILFNFFHVDTGVNDGTKTRFFKQSLKSNNGDEKILHYYLFFATQSLSENNDAVLLTVNIATKEEILDSDGE